MVTDAQEFSTEFVDAITAGEVPGWRHVMIKDPLHASQLAKVLIDESKPPQGWLLSPNRPPTRPGFVVGYGVKVVEG